MKRIYELLQELMVSPFMKKEYSMARVNQDNRRMPSKQVVKLK